MKIKFLIPLSLLFCLTSCTKSDEQKIIDALFLQIDKYPKSTLQDIYKNFYQDRFGTEHAIPDAKSVEDYLSYELAGMQGFAANSIVEKIGWEHNFVRVPLDLVKSGKIPAEELAQAFIESANMVDEKTADKWTDEWNKVISIIEKMNLTIDGFNDDKKEIAKLLKSNTHIALHHSKIFNENYHPHYRIVEKSIYKKRLEKYVE